jgi:hypothetical protein
MMRERVTRQRGCLRRIIKKKGEDKQREKERKKIWQLKDVTSVVRLL